jgi:hypothetical protein
MLKRANKTGIAEKTLRRAKKRLGVDSKRVGFGPDAVWTWSLKAATPVVADPRPSMTINDDDVTANGAKAAKAAIDAHGNVTLDVRTYEDGPL